MPASEVEIERKATLQRAYPWVVIAVAFLTLGAAFGMRNAFAVFLVAVIEEFRWSRGLTSGVLMLGSVMWTLAAPIIGILLDRYGPRVVMAAGSTIMAIGFVVSGLADTVMEFYLGMGFLVGIGFAALPMTSQATFLANWFVRTRGMAMGLTASGIGVGILTVVPLAQYLIAKFGWRHAYFLLAALLVLIVAPLNLFFQRQRPEDMGLAPDFGKTFGPAVPRHEKTNRDSGGTLKQALSTGRFWAFACGALAGAIPLHMVLIHQVAAVADAGFSKELAALGLGLIGLFTAPCMILMGVLADRIGREWSYTVGSAALMIGIFILMFAIDPSHKWVFYAFPPFVAFGFSSRQSLYPTIAADLFYGKNFGAIIGAIALFIGAGSGIGPWLGGAIYDLTGSYRDAFWIAQLLAFLSICLIWVAAPRNYRQRFKNT